MAWDFQTDPEFQQKLDWIQQFVEEELIPLEPDGHGRLTGAIEPIFNFHRGRNSLETIDNDFGIALNQIGPIVEIDNDDIEPFAA